MSVPNALRENYRGGDGKNVRTEDGKECRDMLPSGHDIAVALTNPQQHETSIKSSQSKFSMDWGKAQATSEPSLQRLPLNSTEHLLWFRYLSKHLT